MNQRKRNINAGYLQKMNPGRDVALLVKDFYQRKYKTMGIVLLAGILLSVLLLLMDISNKKISSDGKILRNGYRSASETINAIVKRENTKDIPLSISIRNQEYSQQELSEIFCQAKLWLPDVIKGENTSLLQVENNLYFPSEYDAAPVSISYSVSDYGLIKSTGEVLNEDLKSSEKASVYATFSYKGQEETEEYEVVIVPKVLSEQESFERQLKETLDAEDEEQKALETFTLPKVVAGENIEFKEKTDKRFLYVFALGLLGCAFVYIGMDDDLRKKYEYRKHKLAFAYPGLVSQLALLIGAGMSLTGAVRRIYAEDKNQKGPLYEELTILIHNLDNGILEERALEDFGRRTGLPQYRKFCALLCVNLKKGSLNLKTALEEESEQAFEQHQAQIRKLGEEAGTKLLIPMVLMLAIVIALIMIPAFLTYQIA